MINPCKNHYLIRHSQHLFSPFFKTIHNIIRHYSQHIIRNLAYKDHLWACLSVICHGNRPIAVKAAWRNKTLVDRKIPHLLFAGCLNKEFQYLLCIYTYIYIYICIYCIPNSSWSRELLKQWILTESRLQTFCRDFKPPMLAHVIHSCR